MRSGFHGRTVFLLGPCAAVLLAGACSQQSPEERIEALRAQYDVELTSFSVNDQPLVTPAEDEEAAEPGEVTAEAETAEQVAAAPPPEIPTTTQVLLDILVTSEADDGLPGLTVEVEQVGADGSVKMERTLWLDVSQVSRGSGAQITELIEDVDYQDGDAFAVSIRSPVPPADRGAYREFGNVGSEAAES